MAAIRSLNRAQLIGNLGHDPEYHDYGDGKQLAKFSVATTESWKNKTSGEWDDQTEWHRCVVFNQHLVKVCQQHLTKGCMVYVEGQIKTRKYEKDGVEKYTTEITLNAFDGEIKILKPAGERGAPPAGNSSAPQGETFDDKIPF